MKIRPVGAELFHADGQTNLTELTVALRNFSKAPKNHNEQLSKISSTKKTYHRGGKKTQYCVLRL